MDINSLNITLLEPWILLAQDGGAPASQPSMLMPIAIIMALFYFLILRPQQKKQQEATSMIDSLKEKDRVITIGGIHGVVTNVQRDQEMVTIRIDESTGAKIHVGTSAISRVVLDKDKNNGE